MLDLERRLHEQANFIEQTHNQMSVFIRLMVKHHNFLVEMYNTDLEARDFDDKIPLVMYEEVAKTFAELMEFKSRPDRNEQAALWFMGEDLRQLPPVPSIQTPQTTPVEDSMDGAPDGAQIFGGDYGDSRDEDSSGEAEPSTETGEEDEVHPVRVDDPACDEPADEENGPTVHEVRDSGVGDSTVGVEDD